MQLKLTASVLCSVALVVLFGTYLLIRQSLDSQADGQLKVVVDSIRQELLLGSYGAVSRKCQNMIQTGNIAAVEVTDTSNSAVCSAGDTKKGAFSKKAEIYFDGTKETKAGSVVLMFEDAITSRFLVLAAVSIFLLGVCILAVLRHFSEQLRQAVSAPLAEIGSSLQFISNSENPVKLSESGVISEISSIQREVIHFQRSLRKHEELKVVAARDSAIARTTQALAHDVRKPFSLLQALTKAVSSNADSKSIRLLLNASLPEIDAALASVNGMIQDVMEIGKPSSIRTEPVNPERLIESVLNETFRLLPDARISLSYQFVHSRKVEVDSLRLARVFSNIVGNAVQAMNGRGYLEFRTLQQVDFVEFRISNTGSLISPEHLPFLFDAFFTSGKAGGTGLGLAIARKIVEDHGGQIRCESMKNSLYPDGVVDFIFTLPLSDEAADERAIALPKSSQEILAASQRLAINSAGAQRETSAEEEEIEEDLLSLLRRGKDDFKILVVDDEAIYHNNIQSLLNEHDEIALRIRLLSAKSLDEAIQIVEIATPLLVIQDLDLGKNKPDGIKTTLTLREIGFLGQICIHSNRFVFEDGRVALDAGPNIVLPKPMSRVHLLKLLRASISERMKRASEVDEGSQPSPVQSKKLKVAFVDDSITFRFSWESELGDECDFNEYGSTTAFWEVCVKDEGLLRSFDVIITDFNFAPSDPENGASFARGLRSKGFSGPIFLASGEMDLPADTAILFSGNLGKSPLSIEQLQAKVAEALSAPVS